MAVCVVVGVSGVPGGRLRGMDGVVGVGDVGICGCAPLRPGHPPLVSLRCTRAPLRWSEGGLLVGVCVVGLAGCRVGAPGMPLRACFARTRPLSSGTKGDGRVCVVVGCALRCPITLWIPACAGMTGG